MAEYTLAQRPLQVTTPLGKDVLLVANFSGTETISRPFLFKLELLAENKQDVAFDKLLGQKITVTLGMRDGKTKRYFNGIVKSFSQGERDQTFTAYEMEIVPSVWLLTRKAQSRIFEQITVPDILKQVFEGLDVDFQIQGTFQKRDYCVQYRETDFNFASRLMEEEGIYYFFKHNDGSHTMVVANTPQSHPDLPISSNLIFEEAAGGLRNEDRIQDWVKMQELRSGKYTLWDHCFELPHKHLEADKTIVDSVQVGTVSHKLKVGNNDKLEIYDFPGEYAQRFDGVEPGGGDRPADIQHIFEDNKRTVGIRMEQEALPSLRIEASSNCRHLVTGHKFTLQRHFNADGVYLLTSVTHSASMDSFRSDEGAFEYRNTFTCIPLALPFRPARITPIPFVQGTQSAVVVGPAGEEIFTDKYGRVKVQFHWDRKGKNDTNSSCWVRVATSWAGKRWGVVHTPRIGQEVIVDFLEGDPDSPIIIGSVYNADQMPAYMGKGPDGKHPNDNKVSGIKTCSTKGGNGFNELRFDDTKDKEQIFIHAERDEDLRVKNDYREYIAHHRDAIIGEKGKEGSKGDQREKVFQDKHLTINRNHVEHIGGDMQLRVGGIDGSGNQDIIIDATKKEMIGGESHLHVKGDRKEKIDAGQSLTVGGDQNEKIGMKHAVDAGMEIHLKAGMKVVIEAGMQLTIKAAGSFIDIGPAGVTIQGTMVMINSGGAPGSGSGSSPSAPQDAKQASPTLPEVADNAVTGYKSAP